MKGALVPALALLILALAVATGCGGGQTAGTDPHPVPDRSTPAPAPPAPWAGEPLDSAAVPGPYLAAWRSADNRGSCALLAFAPALERARPTAEPRAARFGGGWGVAWDLPELRSAFGVAGTGVVPGPDTYDDWPHHRSWADGSRAGYGPEGGRGPNQLAYLQVAGQRCLYNVWSRLGREHLESLLERLRYVEGTR